MFDQSFVSASRAFFASLCVSTIKSDDRNLRHLLGISRRRFAWARRVASLAAALVLLGAFCVSGHAQVTLAPNWVQQSPATTPPARFATALAYDSAHGQVVMFGGFEVGTSAGSDTWLWNGTNWTQASPATVPTGVSAQAMAYDPVHGQVVMFGGANSSSTRLNQTSLWNGTNWTNVVPANSPPARNGAMMVYDAAIGKVVLFGGVNAGGSDLGDTWLWDGTNWANAAPANNPVARQQAGMTYDAAHGQVVLFGGTDTFGNYDNDTWVFNGTNWVQQSPATSPSTRYGQGMAYDAAQSQVVMFGGYDGSNYINDTWTWNGATWTQQSPAASPGARALGNGMTYDAARGQLITFGGETCCSDYGDTWALSTGQNFGNVNVCPSGQSTPAPCSSTVAFTYNFASTTTISSIKAVTQGAGGLDFAQANGGNCAGTISAGNSCTLDVTFTPQVPGMRMGAVQIADSVGNLTTTPIYGVGQGPEIAYGPTFSGSEILGGPALEAIIGTLPYPVNPRGMATDAVGDLFIADPSNGRLLMRAPNGTTTTVGTLGFPQDVALDGAGDLFVADTGLQEVVKIPAGCASAACQVSVYKPASADPVAVALDGLGDLFIADSSAGGVVEVPAGCGNSSCWIPIGSGWHSVNALAVDAAGDLFVTDSSAGSVSKMPAGCTSNSCRVGVGSWLVPQGVAVDAAGDLYVSDTAAAGGMGQVTEVPAGCASSSCQIALDTGVFAYHLAVDELGQVYIGDGGNHQVLRINQSVAPAESFDGTNVGFTSLDSPQSFTALNVGNQTLSAILPGFGVPGVNFAQVSSTGPLTDCLYNFSLPPGAVCNVSISFMPQIAGNLTASGTFTDNNLNGAPATQIIALSGSAFNQVETMNLTGAGTGNGSVVANPTGINCSILGGVASGPTCSSSYPGGTGVSLEEVAASGFVFTGWGGDCASAGSSQFCNINTNTNTSTNVTASFAPAVTSYTLTLTETGNGTGIVADNLSQISCSEAAGVVAGVCTGSYPSGTLVTLGATPAAGSTFVGWGGACSSAGTSQLCNVTMNSAANATATFVQGTFGSVNVCANGVTTPAPCNTTIALSYYAAAATTFGATQVVTQGYTGLDFSLGSGGTCTGTVSAGNTCTVNVNFAPLAPGLRTGAVELYDNSANLLATVPVYGVGEGPAIAFGPGVQTTVASGLNGTSGVAVDAAGNVFVSENGGAVKITPYGTQTTLPTSGLSPYVYDVAVDGAGDVFLADAGNNLVVKVTPSGVQTTVASTGLSGPTGVAVDGAGDVFITDTNNNRVIKVTPGGVQTTVPTSGVIHPYYPAVDGVGDVYFLDTGNGRVLKVTPGGIQSTVPISGLAAGNGVAVDAAGDVFVSDQIINVVYEVSPSGVQTTVPTSGLYIPAGLAVDAAGDVFIADNGLSQVFEVSRSQPPSFHFALTNVSSTSTDSPQLVSIQNVGNQALTGSLNLHLGTNFVANASSTCGSGFSLTPGASCNESFSFIPQTTGYLTGTASFSDNTLNLSPLVVLQTVNLVGSGGLNGQAVGVLVPNVVGLTQAAAATPITSVGLALGTVSTASSSIVPSGSVIASNPAAGTQVIPGSAVRLLVSNGQATPPSPNPLSLENNYFVTGDYASAGVTLRGLGVGGIATGTITIPSSTANPGVSQGVPDGADIVDGFLYWETLENTATASGGSGTFLGYPITGQQIGSDLDNYTDGAFTGTLRVYRADVNIYFPGGTNGVRYASGSFTVSLPDSGGTGFPLTEGASLVVIYRVLSPNFPLKSVVIYDGSAIPTTSTTQNVQGFYDALGGTFGTGESTTLFAAGGSWKNSSGTVTTPAQSSQYSAPLNAGSAYAAVILSTPVANSDNDGILDSWKAGPTAGDFYAGQPGYYDVKTGSWVPLPGAKSGEKDLFVQMDYMCGAVLSNGACDSNQENLFPSPDAQRQRSAGHGDECVRRGWSRAPSGSWQRSAGRHLLG